MSCQLRDNYSPKARQMPLISVRVLPDLTPAENYFQLESSQVYCKGHVMMLRTVGRIVSYLRGVQLAHGICYVHSSYRKLIALVSAVY